MLTGTVSSSHDGEDTTQLNLAGVLLCGIPDEPRPAPCPGKLRTQNRKAEAAGHDAALAAQIEDQAISRGSTRLSAQALCKGGSRCRSFTVSRLNPRHTCRCSPVGRKEKNLPVLGDPAVAAAFFVGDGRKERLWSAVKEPHPPATR